MYVLGFNMTKDVFDKEYPKSLFYHRLIESFKHAYAHRALMGDEITPEISEVCKKYIFLNRFKI